MLKTSKKSRRICEICGAREVHLKNRRFFSKFPLDEVRCREWVRVTGNEDLVLLPIEKLHELKHVCGEHFTPRDFNKIGTRLSKNAVPTRNLMSKPLDDYQMSEFPLHVFSQGVKPKTSGNTMVPSNIDNQNTDTNGALLLDEFLQFRQKNSFLKTEPQIKPAGKLLDTQKNTPALTVTKFNSTAPTVTVNSTNSIKGQQIKPAEMLLDTRTMSDATNLNSTEPAKPVKFSYSLERNEEPEKKIKDYEKSYKILLERYKKHMKELRRLRKEAARVERLPQDVKTFLNIQLKNRKKMKGIRYTKDEIMLALKMFKESPVAYNYMKRIFILPTPYRLEKFFLQKLATWSME